MKRLPGWIDRDWERRSYNPLFAFAQRLLWVTPLLAIGAVGLLVGAGPGHFLYDWGLPIGICLMLLLFGYSGYRWFVGYGRTSWHEEQVRKRRRH